MEVIELSAPSVDAATKTAAEKLGVPAERVKVTVLEETKGLFGKSTVKVRAEAAPEAKAKPEPKPKRGAKSAKAVVEAPAEPPVEAASEPKPAKKGRGKKAVEEAAPAPEETPAADVVATDEDAKRLTGLLEGIIKAGDLDVTVTSSGTQGRYVNLVIDGRDVGHLVGKQGEVLNALQYLLNIIANQQVGNGVRATLDGNDYRTRREAALTKLANSIADQVIQRGEEAVLDALPAFERRIVHKALSENSKVSTYSEGEEPNRRVVIAPVE